MKRNGLSGRVAIVTGSSRGIGRETARLLASSGAAVVLNGRNPERLEETRWKFEAEGYKVLAVQGDVTSPEDCRRLIEETARTFGRIDILVNNAGTIMRGRFEEVMPEVFRKVVEGNLLGPAFTSYYALPFLKETRGSLFFISSVAGLRGLPKASPYSAAKMGLTALAESLKIELSGSGVHVGVIHVGFTENDPDKRVLTGDGSLIPVDTPFRKPQEKTAQDIMRCIRKRRYRTVLTPLGKLTRVGLWAAPHFVGLLLRISYKKMERLYR